jgi:hypothetical protein
MLSFIANSVKKIIAEYLRWQIAISLFADKLCLGPTSHCYRPPLLRGSHRLASSGVELVVDFEHSFFKDMGIDLRGGDIGMTQHLLDGS